MTEETGPAFNMGIGGRLMSSKYTGTGVGHKTYVLSHISCFDCPIIQSLAQEDVCSILYWNSMALILPPYALRLIDGSKGSESM